MFIIDDLLFALAPIAIGAITDALVQRKRNKQMLQVMDKSSPANAHFQQKAVELGLTGLESFLKKKLK